MGFEKCKRPRARELSLNFTFLALAEIPQVLHGHDGGVLSLSWCPQDSDLLLSCGKDNRNICWNPQTGVSRGEFPVVTNWTFQTRWNPQNPAFMATASFDGKIVVQSIQSTKPDAEVVRGGHPQNVDDEDFFNKAQTRPHGARFTLKNAPKWLERPCGVSFGFGGKIVSFKAVVSEAPRRSIVRITTFAIDNGVASSAESFETALKKNELETICKNRIAEANSDTERADWKVIKTLISKNPRKELINHLGFSSQNDGSVMSKLSVNGSKNVESERSKEIPASRSNRLSAFFDNGADGDSFLSELAATKGAKTNNPFQIHQGAESESDQRITRALLLGEFDKALDVCLEEDRMSDAFMIAVCGGQGCIDKAQKAYFNRKAGGPNYLRLLASVVGKNLWDLVHNADLQSWKDIMATICTYADATEFPDLCETLGDRLDEQMKAEDSAGSNFQNDASLCYLAGSKLEKVMAIWIAELEGDKGTKSQKPGEDSSFSVHARSLQGFIEKVTIFRGVTQYFDSDRDANSNWKLAALYDKYVEYADIASAHGQLKIAERYLDLLPSNYPAAEAAKGRVKQVTQKAATQQSTTAGRPAQRGFPPEFQPQSLAKPSATVIPNPYTLASTALPGNPYAPVNGPSYGAQEYGDQQSRQPAGRVPPPTVGATFPNQPSGPLTQNATMAASIPPPSKASNMSNWNDTPESFFKAPASRRGTPNVTGNPPSAYQPAQLPITAPSFGAQPKPTPPLGPPPKGPLGPPPRVPSSGTNNSQLYPQPERPSSAANAYIPHQSPLNLPTYQQSTIPRGPSPYNTPPSGPPPPNRYAPAYPSQSAHNLNEEPVTMPGASPRGPPPSKPHAQQQPYNESRQNVPQQPPLSTSQPPHPSGLPSAPSQGLPSSSRSESTQLQAKPAPSIPRHRESRSLASIPNRIGSHK